LATSLDNLTWPDSNFHSPLLALPGTAVVEGPRFTDYATATQQLEQYCQQLQNIAAERRPAWIVIVDDARFAAKTLNNFLWVTFTRSNPARDIYGTHAFTEFKHWGCQDTLIIDARIKPHHAPPLVEDPMITARVDAIAAKGLPISKYL
jgi:4-hydroxy-3-polyprenylbenzoate decarboxylase